MLVLNEALMKLNRIDTKKQLATRLGFKAQSQLTMWENPRYERKPGGYQLYRYYTEFHVPPEWIITGTDARLEKALVGAIDDIVKDKKLGKL